jgi:hypothetical protein
MKCPATMAAFPLSALFYKYRISKSALLHKNLGLRFVRS